MKRISRSNLINIVLAVTLIVVVVFGYFYYLRKDPLQVAVNTVVPEDSLNYSYQFSITGKDNLVLSKPEAIAYGDNKIWVADTDNARIIAFDLNGEPLFAFGNGLNDKIKLAGPVGILVDNNRVFVCDIRLRNIVEYTVDGQLVGYFAHKNVPTPIKLRKYKDMYVALDAAGPGLVYLDSTGKIVHRQQAGRGHKEGELYFPQDLAVVGDRIYVADSNNDRIQYTDDIKNSLKQVSVKEGSEIGFPYCIAVSKEYMFVGSATGMAVRVYGLQEEFEIKKLINESDSEGVGLGIPRGITIDDLGRLYVVDPVHSRVMVYDKQ